MPNNTINCFDKEVLLVMLQELHNNTPTGCLPCRMIIPLSGWGHPRQGRSRKILCLNLTRKLDRLFKIDTKKSSLDKMVELVCVRYAISGAYPIKFLG